MQRSLFKYSILFMLPIAVALGVALQQSLQQWNTYSRQHSQKQANLMAGFYAGHVNQFSSELLNQIKGIIKKQGLIEKLKKKQYTAVKKIVLQDLADTRSVLVIPNNGKGLSTKDVPTFVMHAVNSHRTPRLMINSVDTDTKVYYVMFPLFDKGLKIHLVLQRDLKEILNAIRHRGDAQFGLFTLDDGDLIPIGHTGLREMHNMLIGTAKIDNSNWQIQFLWQSSLRSNRFMITTAIVYILLLITTCACMYGFYKITMRNIGKDLSKLRQIIRDMRQGTVRENYDCRLLEFRAAFGTFQRIAKEISEDHGFMSAKGRDPLTGLPNRESLDDYLGRLLMRLYKENKGFTLFILEINEIDDITHTYGYHSRDAVMAKIATDLKTALRKSDHIARLDENLFAIIFTDISSKLVERLERRLKKYMSQFVELADDNRVRITWSSGYCIANDPNYSLDDVYNQAIESLAIAQSHSQSHSNIASVQVSK